MSLPDDERQHYDEAAQREDEADVSQTRILKAKLSVEQVRHLSLVSMQARQVVERFPDLLDHLARTARTGGPAGAATSSEIALWRAGYDDCVSTIHTAADWPGEEDLDDG